MLDGPFCRFSRPVTLTEKYWLQGTCTNGHLNTFCIWLEGLGVLVFALWMYTLNLGWINTWYLNARWIKFSFQKINLRSRSFPRGFCKTRRWTSPSELGLESTCSHLVKVLTVLLCTQLNLPWQYRRMMSWSLRQSSPLLILMMPFQKTGAIFSLLILVSQQTTNIYLCQSLDAQARFVTQDTDLDAPLSQPMGFFFASLLRRHH